MTNGVFVINPQFEWTGGGYATSARDLARWGHALYAGQGDFAEDARPDDRRQPCRRGSDPRRSYGLGVIVRPTTPAGPTWGHSGFFPGYQTELVHFVEHGVTIALQINSSAPRVTGGRSLLRVAHDLMVAIQSRSKA